MHIYYCMTGRAIRGTIPFEIDCIGLFEGRDNTRGRERKMSPYCPTRGIEIIYLLYEFCVTIGTGNNERAIEGNIAL